ncbi:MAG: stage V sporulation protein AA [Paenibacillaceae bacterium]|nr:stage V sporulation protein AA [Paenibacillaceae bacterium]
MDRQAAGIEAPVLYIRLHKRFRAKAGETIRLRDVAQLLTEPDLLPQLSALPLCTPGKPDGTLLLIDIMTIVAAVRQAVPAIQIEHFGDPHVLVDIWTDERKAHPVLVALVWLLLFIGSGLAIMNFHADVSMLAVHRRIYELLTGKTSEHPLLLQVPYSLGIGLGMALFFNHMFRKRFNDEPSPLEVEMFMYQESIHRYVVTEEYGKQRLKVASGELAVNPPLQDDPGGDGGGGRA